MQGPFKLSTGQRVQRSTHCKALLTVLVTVAGVLTIHGQSAVKALHIHQTDKVILTAPTTALDSLTFNPGHDTLLLHHVGVSHRIPLNKIDSLCPGSASDTIKVCYQHDMATVFLPLSLADMSVRIEGAHVTIDDSRLDGALVYTLEGQSANGSFKRYGSQAATLVLNNVNLTNSSGPALNSQSKKATTILLPATTTNNLTDGPIYATPPTNTEGICEDQKATLFSEGSLLFKGEGSLTVTGLGSDSHGICSDDAIYVSTGHLMVAAATKDGLHANDGVTVSGGNLTITASADGIDTEAGNYVQTAGQVILNLPSKDVKGITTDSCLQVSGGSLHLTVNGAQSKGLKSKQDMTLSGGNITVITTGAAVLKSTGVSGRYDPSYCTAVKCDANLNLSGATVDLTCSGLAGRGVSADGSIVMTEGSLQVTTSGDGAKYTNSSGTADAYTARCLGSNKTISLLGGTINLTSSGAGGRGIKTDGTLTLGSEAQGPTLSVTTKGSKITITSSTDRREDNGTYAEAKAIKADGALTINQGQMTITSADDGLKSDVSVTVNGGEIAINKSTEGMEAPLLTVNNGQLTIISSDDCFNATKGNGGEQNDGSYLYLKGGHVYTSTTSGDGLDSNGNISMSGGTVIVQGPSSQPEVGMDYNGTFLITGGLLAVTGPNSGNMIQSSSSSSTQYAILVKSSSIGTNLVHLQDADGNDLLTLKPQLSAYYVVISSPQLKAGVTYSLYVGGSCTGTAVNGYYTGGTYSGGSLKKTFTLTSKNTTLSF
jgi:trimeric autotransporter adhesin